MPTIEDDVKFFHSFLHKKKDITNKEFIDLLGNRWSKQRMLLKEYYNKTYGEDLVELIKGKLHGNYEDLIVALFEDPVENDCKWLKSKIGKIDWVIGILVGSSKERVKAIVEKLQSQGDNLRELLSKQYKNCILEVLLSILEGKRSENLYPSKEQCKKEAMELHKIQEKQWETQGSLFVKLLCESSPEEFAEISRQYHRLYEKSFDSIDFSKDFKKILVAMANPTEAMAVLINVAIEGWGTDDKLLIKMVVSRDEIDMPQIKKVYQEKYKKDMVKDIEDDTSGNYKEMLSELVSH